MTFPISNIISLRVISSISSLSLINPSYRISPYWIFRFANRLLKRVRDYADVKSDGKINLAIAQEALNLLEIDELGLDNIDRIMLNAIINKFSGGPVGLDTLAASIGEDADTIEDVYEPYLLQLGFINRTPRGRIVTKSGYSHMGLDV